jgi:hypothetical protein
VHPRYGARRFCGLCLIFLIPSRGPCLVFRTPLRHQDQHDCQRARDNDQQTNGNNPRHRPMLGDPG